ncbi:hypothetical protein J7M28_00080, partial [bacterium]|nr:hypothetical protein [bacterium]
HQICVPLTQDQWTAERTKWRSRFVASEPNVARMKDSLLRKARGHKFLGYQWITSELADDTALSDKQLNELLLALGDNGIVVLEGGSSECIDPLFEALNGDQNDEPDGEKAYLSPEDYTFDEDEDHALDETSEFLHQYYRDITKLPQIERTISDLIQEGNIGLIHAVDKLFDYRLRIRGINASDWIALAMERAIEDQPRRIRWPTWVVWTSRRIACASRSFVQQYGREPTPEGLAEILATSVEEILRIEYISQEPISFERPVGEQIDAADLPHPVKIKTGRASGRQGEKIPAPPAPGDEVRKMSGEVISRLKAESSDVGRRLANILDQAEDGNITQADASPAKVPKDTPKSLTDLDPRFRALLEPLSQRQSWDRKSFENLVRQHSLMVSNAIGMINGWADEVLGDFLIEDSDPVVLNLSLLRRALDEQTH